MSAAPRFLVTCEHASPAVPEELRPLFRGAETLLRSHRGHDIGALAIAQHLAAGLTAPLMAGRWSRLVVDLNRSAGNRSVHSELTRRLDGDGRRRLIDAHHVPYRVAVERLLESLLDAGGPVVHVSVHTFTEALNGRVRDLDVGLLFDPAREAERDLCRSWRHALAAARPELRVRFNRPYKGTSDGLTTHLRRALGSGRYAGIELEVSQRIAARPGSRDRLARELLASVPGGGRDAAT